MDVCSVAPLLSDTDNLHTISAISTAPYEIESQFSYVALGFIIVLLAFPLIPSQGLHPPTVFVVEKSF